MKPQNKSITKQDRYDLIVIGGGQAGIPLAHALAKVGQRVALIEQSKLGGSCVNFGCTPTKAVIASARLAHRARRAAEYGLHVPTIEVDFAAVLERAKRVAAESRAGLERDFEQTENPQLLCGHARLDGRDADNQFRVLIDEKVYVAKQVVLNTGTRSSIPKLDGINKINIIHAENWLDHTELPGHLAILGGGYIALEMSQFYRRLGSRVTVIEAGARIASREDEDISSVIQSLLENEGIEFRLRTRGTSVREVSGGITVTLDGPSGQSTLDATHLFVATGRLPNTDQLGLESAGVEVDEHGIINVNERLATNIEGIWVAGDIRGGAQFTHTAWDDYRVLESQLTGDKSRTTRRIEPYAIFIDPELGRVGLTEREARETNREIKVNCYEMRKNGKAREIGETQGFIKVIVDAATNKLLGAAVLASEGAELVHLYTDLMNADAPYTVLRDAVHIHPTLAEAVQSAVKSL